MRLFYRRVITAAERPCLSKRGADRGWSLLTVPLTRELMLQRLGSQSAGESTGSSDLSVVEAGAGRVRGGPGR